MYLKLIPENICAGKSVYGRDDELKVQLPYQLYTTIVLTLIVLPLNKSTSPCYLFSLLKPCISLLPNMFTTCGSHHDMVLEKHSHVLFQYFLSRLSLFSVFLHPVLFHTQPLLRQCLTFKLVISVSLSLQ